MCVSLTGRGFHHKLSFYHDHGSVGSNSLCGAHGNIRAANMRLSDSLVVLCFCAMTLTLARLFPVVPKQDI